MPRGASGAKPRVQRPTRDVPLEEKAMNLTAHPYTVLAELCWKQDSLGGANRTRQVAHAARATADRDRPWRRLVGRLTTRRPRHTPRPV
jgi:hypothetical protein